MKSRLFSFRPPDRRRIGFAPNESGATAVEYGLIVAFIAIVIVASTQLVGANLQTFFQDLANAWPG